MQNVLKKQKQRLKLLSTVHEQPDNALCSGARACRKGNDLFIIYACCHVLPSALSMERRATPPEDDNYYELAHPN